MLRSSRREEGLAPLVAGPFFEVTISGCSTALLHIYGMETDCERLITLAGTLMKGTELLKPSSFQLLPARHVTIRQYP
jgi:hypothetical protein